MNVKKFCITLCAVLTSVLLIGIGVSTFVECRLGSDTLTVLLEGLHKNFNISLGSANRICNYTLLLLALLLSRKEIGLATVVSTLTAGYAIDFFYPLIQSLEIHTYPFMMRVVIIFIAQLCLAFSYAILIKYRKGMQSMDAIIYFFVNNFHIPYMAGRIIMDTIFTVSGWLLGGVVGIGTIIACCTTGFMVDSCLKVLRYKKSYNPTSALHSTQDS